MITALIVDDERPARYTLSHLLKTYCPQIDIIREAQNLEEALHLVKTSNPQLVFLDIALNGTTGFQFLNALGTYNFQLIFVTAFDEYAIKAFKYSAIDYLLKPVNSEELINSVAKSLNIIAREEQYLKIEALVNNIGTERNKKIVLKTSSEVFLINSKDIIRLEATNNYTSFYTKDKRKILVSVTLKEYEEMLSDLFFFRPHQSHLINLDFFEKFDKRNGGLIIMSDNSQIPVSVRKREELNLLLNKISK